MKETVCAVSSLNCQVGNAGRPPTHIASLSSSLGEGSRMSFIQPSSGIKAKGYSAETDLNLHRCVSHLSNIYNPIVLFTSPPPPPAEQLTSHFPSCMARCLIHLTDSSSLWAHYCTIYGRGMDATTYLKSTLFITIYSTVPCGHGRICPRSDETIMYPCCLNNLLTIALVCPILQRAACV